MDAVENAEVVRQIGGEAPQRRDLEGYGAGGFQRLPSVREGAGHLAFVLRGCTERNTSAGFGAPS
jgi:hypothetical protein